MATIISKNNSSVLGVYTLTIETLIDNCPIIFEIDVTKEIYEKYNEHDIIKL